MIKVLLWDLDGTLLNFDAAEHNALKACFEKLGLGVCTDEMIERYVKINKQYWQKLERGEISKQEVLIGRFREFFRKEGLEAECAEGFNEEYQIRLGDTIVFCDDAFELVKEFKQKGYLQYIVTNGTKVAQDRKLDRSGLRELFDGIFISEEVGFEKPMKGFFDKVFNEIGTYHSDEVIIIGDSLSSDMCGGNNVGITCCWYNPKKEANQSDLQIDYEIADLRELKEILDFNEKK